jgi:HK97 family phage portal protein
MILEAFASMFSSISFAGSHPRDPAVAKMMGLGKQNTAGVNVTHEKVMALPAIKRAVQIITDKMYGMPWYVFEEDGDTRTWERTHPAWRCVNLMANKEIDAPSLRQQLTQWAMIWGNGCAWIDRESDSGRIELYPLRPDKTQLVRVSPEMAEKIGGIDDQIGELKVKTMIGQEVKYLDYEDVLHIKGLGDNPYWGWDIAELLSEAFGGAMAKDEFSNRFFSGGANPVGFITMDGSLDEESEETYMQSLQKAMTGLGKAHKVILLEEGAKFQQVTIDPIKSQMLEGKQFDIRLLAMAIGIKVHKLIDGANSAFASLEQANHEHKDDDILPWVNKFRVQYARKLLTSDQLEQGSHSIDVDDEALDWVPFSDRARGSVELYNNGLITKEEGRRKVNFGPSKSVRADQFRIPANILYEDDQALIGTQPQPKSQQNEQPEPNQDDESVDYSDVADAYLDRIEKRLMAQAKAKAKSPADFLSWLDSLKTEEGPKSIQPRIDSLYATIIERLNKLAATAKTAEELQNAI